jgi:endonuclease YncB( thermonuclease family)
MRSRLTVVHSQSGPWCRRSRRSNSPRHLPEARRARRRSTRELLPWAGLAVVAVAWIVGFGLFPGRASTPESASLTGRVHVIDGDTLALGGRRIRIHGVDAPESDQTCEDADGARYACGRRAAGALRRAIGGQAVSCNERGRDRYGRIIAVCYAGGEDLGAVLVRQGWAVAYTRYSFAYLLTETRARVAGRGMWSGTFTRPEDWRHG